MMNNLIIKLRGGTGNQLFQAAAAISLAQITNKSCKFNSENIGSNKYKRKVEIFSLLNYLNIEEKIIDNKNNYIFLDESDINHPIYFSDISPLSKIQNNIVLEGYFTNYRIHKKELIQGIKNYLSNLKIKNNFKDINLISIHLRELHGAGDNNINKEVDNLSIDYYSKALHYIKKSNNFSELTQAIIFSDMWKVPEKSLLLPKIKNLLYDLNIEYINGDTHISTSLEIINIFSNSAFCIISNSSLSWWGAYLSDGEIYSPVMSLWEPNLNIPDNWIQIYSGEINPKTHHKNTIFFTPIKRSNELNYKIYNSKRLVMIKIWRKIVNKITLIFRKSILRNF